MRKNVFTFIVLFLLVISLGTVDAQCTWLNKQENGTTYYPRISNQTVGQGNASFLRFQVKNTAIYHWDVCGFTGYDTNLSGYNASNTGVWFNDDYCAGYGGNNWSSSTTANGEYTANYDGQHSVQLNVHSCQDWNSGYGSATLTYRCSPPSSPAQLTAGNGTWNIYCYDAGDAAGGNNAWVSAYYAGYYTDNALNFNTTTRWANGGTPYDANATGGQAYRGCYIPADNHSWSAVRTNIPCGGYQLQVQHDDIGQIFINGTSVYNNASCCTSTNAGTYVIKASDVITYRVSEGGGGSDGLITFNATAALSGGTIAGIANPTTVCQGTDPGAFTSTANPSGGASAAITYGSNTFQWERAPTNTFASITNVGGNSATYDPDNSLGAGTYFFRRKVTDACGAVAYSNVIQVNVTATNTIALNTANATQTVCSGVGIANITYNTTGATGVNVTGLPSGVTGTWSGNVVTISGTPNVPAGGSFPFTVTMTGGCTTGQTAPTGTITVTATNTIALNTANATQTVCSGVGIANITYNTTGATGVNVTGLPSGVTGTWSGNVVTISGTPNVPAGGSFPFTVTMTGGCTTGQTAPTGTITVTATNTIALNTANATQTRCSGVGIANITYNTTGATGVNVTGLPSGVTGTWSGNVVTISGTPNVPAGGSFPFTVTMTGGCTTGQTAPTGTITVTATNTIALNTANATQTVCSGVGITNITYNTTGATGVNVTGLPSGVTGTWSGNVVTISGTPNVPAGGSFPFTVTMTGGCTTGQTAPTGTITVTATNTIALNTANATQTRCSGVGIANITYNTTGATGVNVTGLPSGVTGTWSGNVVTISGTPNVPAGGSFPFTVTMTGGCTTGQTAPTGTITVTATNTIALNTANATQTVCSGVGIANITYNTTGATGVNVTGLPSGVTGTWSGNVVTISGAPNVPAGGSFPFTVTMTGGCTTGQTAPTGTITVKSLPADPTSISLSSNNYCANTPPGSLNLTINGGAFGTGGQVQWYTGSCGGTLVGTTVGATLTLSGGSVPTVNTTYYARYAADCNTTNCTSVPVSVIALPAAAPTSVTSTPSSGCVGSLTPTITLFASGGTPGTGGVANWYTGSCGGTFFANGSSQTVPTPSSTTQYFVRYENSCGQTSCSDVTFTVSSPSSAPTGISGTTTLCNGNGTVLTATGGTLGTGANYQWGTGNNPGINPLVGETNVNLSVTPSSTTIYWVRIENTTSPCTGNTGGVTTNVQVDQAITTLTATASPNPVCDNSTLTLTASNTGGTNITWSWSGPAGFNVLNQQNTSRSSLNEVTHEGVYTVKAINACHPGPGGLTANTASVVIHKDFGFVSSVSVNPNPVCEGSNITLTANFANGTPTEATYSWTGPNSFSSSLASPTRSNMQVADGGNYSVTVSNACAPGGLSNAAIATLQPVITASIAVDNCMGTSPTDKYYLLVTGSGGTGTLSYSGTPVISVANQRVYYEPAGSTVNVTITDQAAPTNCSKTVSVTAPSGHPQDIPLTANVTSSVSVNCYDVDLDRWVTFRDNSNNAILSINDNINGGAVNNNLGLVNVTVYKDALEPTTYTTGPNCQTFTDFKAMKRHFVITTTNPPTSGEPVGVRLYFTQAEAR
jgi:hypothetical protein